MKFLCYIISFFAKCYTLTWIGPFHNLVLFGGYLLLAKLFLSKDSSNRGFLSRSYIKQFVWLSIGFQIFIVWHFHANCAYRVHKSWPNRVFQSSRDKQNESRTSCCKVLWILFFLLNNEQFSIYFFCRSFVFSISFSQITCLIFLFPTETYEETNYLIQVPFMGSSI